jgi:hypothetical protein
MSSHTAQYSRGLGIRRRIVLAAVGLSLVALPAMIVCGEGEQAISAASTVPAAAPVPPPDAKGLVVLFGGKQEDVGANWVRAGSTEPAAWQVRDGAMVVRGGNIASRQQFTDYQLHVEFKVPLMPNARGQGRGNSGVFLNGRYEIQVLDSYGKETPGTGDCGALYGVAAPLVNACKPPLEWQTYDIVFRSPRYDADTGDVVEPGRVTVLQNGITIQNNQEIPGPTGRRSRRGATQQGPIMLQDHGNPVEYRNIWLFSLPQEGAKHY